MTKPIELSLIAIATTLTMSTLNANADAAFDAATAKFERQNSSFEHRHKGHEFEKAKNYVAAIDEYSKAILDDPTSSSAYESRAWLYAEQKKYQESINDYKKAISLDPKTFQNYGAVARIYEQMGSPLGAIEFLSSAIVKKPNSLYLYSLRAAVYERAKLHAKAVADYKFVYDTYTKQIAKETDKKELADLYAVRGNILFDQKMYAKAIEDFDCAIFYNSNDAANYGFRGDIYHELKDSARATSDFKQAALLDPKELKPAFRRKYSEVAQLFKAVDDASTAIEKEPTAANYAQRASAKEIVGEYESAISDYTKAIELEPTKVKILIDRGQCHYKLVIRQRAIEKSDLENAKAATDDFTTAIQMEPNNAWAYALRGSIFVERGYRKKALQDFDHALNLNKNYPEVYARRASLYKDLGQYKKSMSDLIKSITSDPKNVLSSISKLLELPHEGILMADAAFEFDDSEDPQGKTLEGEKTAALSNTVYDSKEFDELEFEKKQAESRFQKAQMQLKLSKNNWAKLQLNSASASINRETALIKARAALDVAKKSTSAEQMASAAKLVQSDLLAVSGDAANAEQKAAKAEANLKTAEAEYIVAEAELSRIKKKMIPVSIEALGSQANTYKVLLERMDEESAFLLNVKKLCKFLSSKSPDLKTEFLCATGAVEESATNLDYRLKLLSGNAFRIISSKNNEMKKQLALDPKAKSATELQLAALASTTSSIEAIFKKWNPPTTKITK